MGKDLNIKGFQLLTETITRHEKASPFGKIYCFESKWVNYLTEK